MSRLEALLRRFPDSLLLLFSMGALAQRVTYAIPAGRFERAAVQRAAVRTVWPALSVYAVALAVLTWAALVQLARGIRPRRRPVCASRRR